MLLQFSCSNHKSIKDEILFSAVASGEKRFIDNLIPFSKDKSILKSAAIYGANGTGKSNIIDAINFMRSTVITSVKNQPGDNINQKAHKLSSLDDTTKYDIQFTIDSIRYAYGFSLLNSLIYEEYLYFFPNGRKTKIFTRKGTKYEPGSKFSNSFDTCKDVIKDNRLFISCAANYSNVKEIIAVFFFFKDDIVIYSGKYPIWMQGSLRAMNTKPHIKEQIIQLLNKLDIPIKDILFENIEIDASKLYRAFFDDVQEKNKTLSILRTDIVYENFEVDLNEESTGVQKLIEILYPLLDAAEHNRILIFDEIECNIHESIIKNLVHIFSKINLSNKAQLFFTTHDTSLLSLDLFRKDQIWFTELKSDHRSTDLYSLAEIKNIRNYENIEKGYITGRYGAIPMLNNEFANIFADLAKDAQNE